MSDGKFESDPTPYMPMSDGKLEYDSSERRVGLMQIRTKTDADLGQMIAFN
jgi:hypothetical protein